MNKETMNKKTLSATTLKSLISCNNYESEKNQKPNFAAERGSVIHALLEGVRPETVQTLGIEYRNNYRILAFPEQHDWNEYDGIVSSVHADFLEPLNKTGFVKKELVLSYDYSPEIELTGVIDGIWQGYNKSYQTLVFDYKTGQTDIDINNPFDAIQSIVYSFLYMKQSGEKSVKFAYVWLNEFGIDEIVSKEITMEYAEKMIAVFISKLNVGEEKIGIQCRNCSKQNTCPKFSGALTLVNKNQPFDLTVKNPDNYKVVKAMQSALEKWVQEYKEAASPDQFSTMNLMYLDTENLSTEEKANLISGRIRISKEKAANYPKEAIVTIQSKRFKG
jgi:hypothetical protein